MHVKMSQYSFPILENDELLSCLEEMEVSLDPNTLAKPTYEVVRSLYESILSNLAGVTREELIQPVFTAVDAFEYPQLFEEAVRVCNFFRQLNKLMMCSGVKDLGQKDVFKPESVRLRRHLSALVNFAKFREEKLVSYTEAQDKLEELLAVRRQLEDENGNITAELTRLQTERMAAQPELSRLEAEIQDILNKNQQLYKDQSALHNEVKLLKQQSNQLADTAAAVKFETITVKQDGEKLQAQVVQSPEKFQRSIMDLQRQLEAEQQQSSELEKKFRDTQSRMDTYSKVLKEVQKSLKMLEELDVEIVRKKEKSNLKKDVKSSIESKEAEVAALIEGQQHLKRQQGNLLEKIQRLEHQAAFKLEAAASQVEEQLKEKEAVQAENAVIEAKLAENQALVNALREKAAELRSTHSSQTQAILEKYAALLEAVSRYNQQLKTARST